MANFFKSTLFKCVAVLLALSVIFGGTLAILNDVLYVSPDERTMRAIKKIYGTERDFDIVRDVDSTDTSINQKLEYDIDDDDILDGSINKVYTVDKDTLFQATGYNGYKGGTITVWVKVSTTNDRYVIEQVLMESFTKQTLMSKLDSNFYNKYLLDVTDAYENGQNFTTQGNNGEFSNPVANATYSANAGNNAVNCVIRYLGEMQ